VKKEMTTKTFYHDVEFDLEVEYNIKAKSDIVNFNNTKKETQKVTIFGENIEKAKNSFSNEVGFDLTTEQVLAVIFSDTMTIRDLINGYTDNAAKSFFCNVFAKFTLKDDRHWPIFMDDEEYTDKFFSDLNYACYNLGYIKMNM
jgi:cell fate (sporulation/competence/biofilm development) regulator YlbF (YheA/YmcA/DUF963 family)